MGKDKIGDALDDLFRALEFWYNACETWPREPQGGARLYQAYHNWLELIMEDTPGESE